MALIGTIRERFGWLMMGLVVIGVVGFLFMDVGAGRGNGPTGTTVAGTVNGKQISRMDLDGYTSDYSNPRFIQEESRARAWNQLVSYALAEEKARLVGLSVSDKEMGDLFVGNNISQFVASHPFFQNPQTNTFDKDYAKAVVAQLSNLDLSQVDPRFQETALQQKAQYERLEETVKSDRLADKYAKMLGAALYTPTWMAEMRHKLDNKTYNLSYVKVPYASITNEDAPVTDADLQAYLDENSKLYPQKAAVNIGYVIFDVLPSAEDSANYVKSMQDKMAKFPTSGEVSEDSIFLKRQNGFNQMVYFTKDELQDPVDVRDSLFVAAEGTVFGPYIQDRQYKVLKLLDRKELADSAQCKHILLAGRTVENRDLLDSLKTEIEAGRLEFDTAVAKYSQDLATKDNGGLRDYFGKDDVSVEENFKQVVFNQATKDSLMIVLSRSGVHLMKVTDFLYNSGTMGVRVGYFTKPIVPSAQTIKNVRYQATNFLTENTTWDKIQETATKQNLTAATASGLQMGEYQIAEIGKGSDIYKMIKWAHTSATIGSVAEDVFTLSDNEYKYTRKIIVPALISKITEGTASLENPNIKAEVDRVVRNKKKAAYVKSKIGSAQSLEEVAAQFNVTVQTPQNPVSYGSAQIVGEGIEGELIAIAESTELDKVSVPVAGNGGVFVVKVAAKNDAPAMADVKAAKDKVAQENKRWLAKYALLSILREAADVEDTRYDSY